jgi:hypothetical protein
MIDFVVLILPCYSYHVPVGRDRVGGLGDVLDEDVLVTVVLGQGRELEVLKIVEANLDNFGLLGCNHLLERGQE